ncbi:MAG: ketol-acid reductoisomerase [Candidatus Eisenbacteria bacterium]|uniref:Ketol-acid reductoisomerase n=1 Tax=Eiseniibacteriota bacterium TaxID=2212470 RepID=A0A956ND70_UNCEI|nr:ketol-acid reductoisomerase [Candidatus Eisenbacteria bacterium]MCB9463754.1 ketol-acid reductoisomerase [Candidatus Eisenbacteria bacterium]
MSDRTLLTLADCPLDPIEGWTVAVVGFGNQGTAQAQNLRDSGFRVVIGADPGRPSRQRAQKAGFDVLPLGAVLSNADLVVLVAPDELHSGIVAQMIGLDDGVWSAGLAETSSSGTHAEAASEGVRDEIRTRAWVFSHGFSLVHDPPPIPETHDVFVVAPAGPGVQVRQRYQGGEGVPALLAVHRDASGVADARARAYAAAIGSARAGLLRTTVKDEVDIDLFGEQAVLCGGMNALTQAAFDTLVSAGYAPEAAYLECVHQLRLTAELVERFGIEGMRRRISSTALYGDLTRGPRIGDEHLRQTFREVLDEVRSGAFAREWLAARRRSPDWSRSAPGQARHASLEDAGRVVRGLWASGEDGEAE